MTLIITAAKPVHMCVTAPAQLVDVWERDQNVVVPVLDLPGLVKVLFSVEEYRVIHNLFANMQLHMCSWEKKAFIFSDLFVGPSGIPQVKMTVVLLAGQQLV